MATKQTVTLSESDADKARRIAANLGCVSSSGPRVGEGSIQVLVQAIVDGSLLVVANPAVATNGR